MVECRFVRHDCDFKYVALLELLSGVLGVAVTLYSQVEDSGTDEEIPLPNVKTAVLSKAP